MKIKKVYYWKVISEDGLLKEYEYGPYYSRETLNHWGGFDTEEEAVSRIEKLSSVPDGLILITAYEQIYE